MRHQKHWVTWWCIKKTSDTIYVHYKPVQNVITGNPSSNVCGIHSIPIENRVTECGWIRWLGNDSNSTDILDIGRELPKPVQVQIKWAHRLFRTASNKRNVFCSWHESVNTYNVNETNKLNGLPPKTDSGQEYQADHPFFFFFSYFSI